MTLSYWILSINIFEPNKRNFLKKLNQRNALKNLVFSDTFTFKILQNEDIDTLSCDLEYWTYNRIEIYLIKKVVYRKGWP